MRKHRVLLMVLALAMVAGAQAGKVDPATAEPFMFQGATLGMTLEQFRVLKNTGQVSIYVLDPTRKKGHQSVPKAFNLPICSDQFPDMTVPAGTSYSDGKIICDASYHEPNGIGLNVAGEEMDFILWTFYSGRLAEIEMWMPGRSFNTVVAAFRAKYGEPSVQDTSDFQNIFGARWTGKVIGWRSGLQGIYAWEGEHNGPAIGYLVDAKSVILFADISLVPKPKRPKVNF